MAAVAPIETPTTDELRAFYERIERTSRGLGVLNVFKVMAHSPELMESWQGSLQTSALPLLRLGHNYGARAPGLGQ